MSEHTDSPTDEMLAKMAQAGDRAAFETLCDRYLSCVYNRLRALLPPHAVEDVTQEVFVAILRGIERYRGQALFRTWVASITRHKAADYYRKRNRQPETVAFDGVMADPAEPDTWKEHALMRIALRRLPAHYQEILLLRFAEGMPFAQIAGALGISLEASKSRYRRAIAAIAQEIGIDRDGPP
jgi:RNA polymerase sigma factor (sigma-70 family)